MPGIGCFATSLRRRSSLLIMLRLAMLFCRKSSDEEAPMKEDVTNTDESGGDFFPISWVALT
ncbi:hypothetical protein [Sphingobium fuliginis]|jgi:hypothetical protein|nr:hypothetical protein [Sphingobium fuliginis]